MVKTEKLAEVLDTIRLHSDPPPDLFRRFQEQYRDLPPEEKLRFFDFILRRMEIQKGEIEEPVRGLLTADSDDPAEWSRVLTTLRRRMESPRLRAFRRFVSVSGGFKFLLDFRADLLAMRRQTTLDLEPLDEELSYLFNTWFQSGFLFLQEITRDSSFRQIRFLKEHEMVHPMASLEEIWNRLGNDRRCFALYHRAMPEEPVVFIEAALTRGIARSIHAILQAGDQGTAARPDTAVFYSINNTQDGLIGLGLARILIFGVVDAIKTSQPGIKTFCTLSPIPGFWQRYLKPILEGNCGSFAISPERFKNCFSEKAQTALIEHHAQTARNGKQDLSAVLLEILPALEWIDDPVYANLLRWPLTELTYFYITKEKDRRGRPLDPVANFHMNNGARVSFENINFGANRSERGHEESCGMMVNYVYTKTWLQQMGSTMRSLLKRNGR